jgi:hypothetical protein
MLKIHTGVGQVNIKQVNVWLDIFLAIGLVMAMMPGVTGLPMHQGIGIVLGIGVVIHLILHRKWIVATCRSCTKLSAVVRFKLVLNILSLLAFSLTLVSGLMNAGTISSDVGGAAVIQPSNMGAAFGADGLGRRLVGREMARPAAQREDSGFHWHAIHHANALLALLTVTLHLALNRKWLASNARRSLGIESGEKQSQLEAKEGA